MKKILIFIVLILGGYFVIKSGMLEKPVTYTNIDLGWAKTSLPFTLQEQPQKAKQAWQTLNEMAHSKIVQGFEYYSGNYPEEFILDVSYMKVKPSIPLNPQQGLISAIAGSAFKNEATQAMKYTQQTKENGAIKYIYKKETTHKNSPFLLVVIQCVKKNQAVVFFGNGKNTNKNKGIIDHIITTTECFQEKK